MNYLPRALIAGVALSALSLVGCGKSGVREHISELLDTELPIYDSTAKRLESSESNKAVEARIVQVSSLFDRSLKNARDIFNKSISDGIFDIYEQGDVEEAYANVICNKIRAYEEISALHALNQYDPRTKMWVADEILYRLLMNENRKGLQVAFDRNNLKVIVEDRGRPTPDYRASNWYGD
ncbi:hypothetical protein J4217_04685 [Candidatus Pacearchaeota archaeon]|nr:hypothetical protein [Candidatus Pacearchaeota archaeon]